MNSDVTTRYYLLREGSTNEEQWTWEEIEEMCASGELGRGSQVYLPDKDRWCRLDETDLAERFDGIEERDDEERESITTEYDEALRNLEAQPDSIDLLVEAGRLASDLGETPEARRHFQRALELKPYHGRVAQEVIRCFSPADCARFRLLNRPDSVFDDLAAPVNYALSGGPLYLAVPAAVFAALSFVPGGVWLSAVLAVLWCFQMVKRVSEGDSNPPRWQYALADPVGEMVLPLCALIATSLPLLAVFFGVARLVMLFDAEVAGSTIEYIANSPILAVTFVVAFVAYLPGVVMRILRSRSAALLAINPAPTLRLVARAGHEYALTVVVVLGVAFLVGLVYALLGGIKVAGNVITAGSLAFALPTVAFVVGRLSARSEHVF